MWTNTHRPFLLLCLLAMLGYPSRGRSAGTPARAGAESRPNIALDESAPEQHSIATLRGLLGQKNVRRKVYSVAFSPDGKALAWGENMIDDRPLFDKPPQPAKVHGFVTLWDVAVGKERMVLDHDLAEPGRAYDSPQSVAFSPDGTIVANGWSMLAEKTGSVGLITLYESATGKRLTTAVAHGATLRLIRFSPDGKTLASADLNGDVKLWDFPTLKQRLSFQGNVNTVHDVAFSPDGKMLAVAGGERGKESDVTLWDAVTGERKGALKGHHDWVAAVTWLPDGKTIASTNFTGVELWDADTKIGRAEIKGSMGILLSLVSSPDGKTLAASNEGPIQNILLYDVASAQLVRVNLYDDASSLAFSPDGTKLASGSGNLGTVYLWNVQRALDHRENPESR